MLRNNNNIKSIKPKHVLQIKLCYKQKEKFRLPVSHDKEKSELSKL